MELGGGGETLILTTSTFLCCGHTVALSGANGMVVFAKSLHLPSRSITKSLIRKLQNFIFFLKKKKKKNRHELKAQSIDLTWFVISPQSTSLSTSTPVLLFKAGKSSTTAPIQPRAIHTSDYCIYLWDCPQVAAKCIRMYMEQRCCISMFKA